ncbi:hypothetical protein A2U01_0094968, partial [Trifolium medium]|nr:hypothetical protein [Trifolium medium]
MEVVVTEWFPPEMVAEPLSVRWVLVNKMSAFHSDIITRAKPLTTGE